MARDPLGVKPLYYAWLGEDTANLQTTYGFPKDLTLQMAQELKLTVDEAGYEQAIDKHREISGQGREKIVTKTVTGEIVDMGCYLGHAASGQGHVSCATKCLNQGMPMGLLTSNGTLYLVTLDHDNADPYNSLKTMAGKMVTVTGPVLSRNGMKGLDVTAVAAATATK